MFRFFLIFLLFPFCSFSFSCDSISLSNIINPGPYTVISIDESSGIRNGTDYSGSTIYYPSNGNKRKIKKNLNIKNIYIQTYRIKIK